MYNNLIDIYVEVEDVKKSVDGNTHIMYTVTAMNEEEVIDTMRFVRVMDVEEFDAEMTIRQNADTKYSTEIWKRYSEMSDESPYIVERATEEVRALI